MANTMVLAAGTVVERLEKLIKWAGIVKATYSTVPADKLQVLDNAYLVDILRGMETASSQPAPVWQPGDCGPPAPPQ